MCIGCNGTASHLGTENRTQSVCPGEEQDARKPGRDQFAHEPEQWIAIDEGSPGEGFSSGAATPSTEVSQRGISNADRAQAVKHGFMPINVLYSA